MHHDPDLVMQDVGESHANVKKQLRAIRNLEVTMEDKVRSSLDNFELDNLAKILSYVELRNSLKRKQDNLKYVKKISWRKKENEEQLHRHVPI